MKPALRILVPVSLALAIGAMILTFGNDQFAGFDQSLLVEVFQRSYLGQVPVRSYPSTLPLLFALPGKLVFAWLGVSWSAIVTWTALFAVAAFLAQYALLASIGVPVLTAGAIAFAAQLCGQIVSSFWWYNSFTAVLASVFITATFAVLRRPAWITWAAWTVAGGLLSLTKPNLAALWIAVGAIAIGVSAPRRRELLRWLPGIPAIFLATAWAQGVSITALAKGYLGVGTKAFPSIFRLIQDHTLERFASEFVAVDCALMMVVCHTISRVRKNWAPDRALLMAAAIAAGWAALTIGVPWFAIGAIGVLLLPIPGQDPEDYLLSRILLVTGFALHANGESKLTDLAPLMTAATVAFVSAPVASRVARGLFWGAFAIIAYVAVDASWQRDRIDAAGRYQFFDRARPAWVGDVAPFFASLRTSVWHAEVVREMARLFASGPAAPRRVFLGPRLGFGYGAFGLEPPLDLPAWWHPGFSYNIEQGPELARRFRDADFEVAVFYARDAAYATFMPREVMQYLASRYDATTEGPLAVFRKRP